MDIRLLGPVRAWAGGVAVDLGPPRQRLVLAVLAMEAGRPVRAETLIDRLWGDAPPQRARESLYVHVTRLRAALRQAGDTPVITRRSGGYLLDADPSHVDVHRFEALLTRARAARHADAQQVALLRECLSLWQAEPLADVTGAWVEQVRQSLADKRLDAVAQWAGAQLRLGYPEEVIAPLAELLDARPFAESLTALLMRALAESGRNAEALDRYAATRARLADELGTDPSPELQRLHQAILRGEAGPRPVEPPVTAPASTPGQLPMDVYGFTGRELERKQLSEIRDHGVAPLVVVTGTAGVGKTAFAVHWAHANVDRYTDGQLYLDLRGFDAAGRPVTAMDALGRLLRSLGVEARAVPRDVDEAATLYRSLLAGRRVLLLLDNARDVTQIRPLLPGTGTSMVLVTSRGRLGGLLAREGARLITLGPLSPAQAHRLLDAMLGAQRVAADPRSAELARRCAYLPLALRIAAANLAARPELAIADYADRMADPGALEVLRIEGDETAAVAAAFDVSYAALSPAAQRLFRLTSLCRGPDLGFHAAAALAQATPAQTRAALDELCAAHLLGQDGDGRYTAHDLLRAYAAQRLRRDDGPQATVDAARRLVDFYTDTTYEASTLFLPRRNSAPRDIRHPPAEPLRFTDRDAALHWHELERDNLVGVVALAAEHGWHKPAWQLAETLFQYFFASRRWAQWTTVTEIGLTSAQATGDREAIARLHVCMGVIHKQTGDYAAARASWTRAMTEAAAAGHDRLVTTCHINLGGLCVNEGDPASGAAHLRQALANTAYSSDPRYGVVLYVNYGCALLDLDDLTAAAEALNQALTMATTAHDLVHLCHAHHNLAEIALRQGDLPTARHHATEQLRVVERSQDPLRLAAAWDLLGSATCQADPALARHHWQRAQTLFAQVNHRLAEPMAQWLATSATMDHPTLREADARRRLSVRKMI